MTAKVSFAVTKEKIIGTDTLLQMYATVNNELDQLKNFYKDCKSKNKDLTNDNSLLKIENERLKFCNTQNTNGILKLTEERDSLKKENIELEHKLLQHINNKQTQFQEFQNEQQMEMELKLSEYTDKLKAQTQETNKLLAENKKLKKTGIITKSPKKPKIIIQQDILLSKDNKIIKSLSPIKEKPNNSNCEIIENLKAQENELKKKVSKLTLDNEKLTTELESAKLEYSLMETDLNQQISKFESDLKDQKVQFQSEINKLKKQNSPKKKEHIKCTKCPELQNQLDCLELQVKTLVNENNNLKSRNKVLKSENKTKILPQNLKDSAVQTECSVHDSDCLYKMIFDMSIPEKMSPLNETPKKNIQNNTKKLDISYPNIQNNVPQTQEDTVFDIQDEFTTEIPEKPITKETIDNESEKRKIWLDQRQKRMVLLKKKRRLLSHFNNYNEFRIKNVHLKRRNRVRNCCAHQQKDVILDALLALKKSNVNFMISNENYTYEQNIHSIKKTIKFKNERDFRVIKSECCLKGCQTKKTPYMVVDDEGGEKLLGFFNVKNEKLPNILPPKDKNKIHHLSDILQKANTIEKAEKDSLNMDSEELQKIIDLASENVKLREYNFKKRQEMKEIFEKQLSSMFEASTKSSVYSGIRNLSKIEMPKITSTPNNLVPITRPQETDVSSYLENIVSNATSPKKSTCTLRSPEMTSKVSPEKAQKIPDEKAVNKILFSQTKSISSEKGCLNSKSTKNLFKISPELNLNTPKQNEILSSSKKAISSKKPSSENLQRNLIANKTINERSCLPPTTTPNQFLDSKDLISPLRVSSLPFLSPMNDLDSMSKKDSSNISCNKKLSFSELPSPQIAENMIASLVEQETKNIDKDDDDIEDNLPLKTFIQVKEDENKEDIQKEITPEIKQSTRKKSSRLALLDRIRGKRKCQSLGESTTVPKKRGRPKKFLPESTNLETCNNEKLISTPSAETNEIISKKRGRPRKSSNNSSNSLEISTDTCASSFKDVQDTKTSPKKYKPRRSALMVNDVLKMIDNEDKNKVQKPSQFKSNFKKETHDKVGEILSMMTKQTSSMPQVVPVVKPMICSTTVNTELKKPLNHLPLRNNTKGSLKPLNNAENSLKTENTELKKPLNHIPLKDIEGSLKPLKNAEDSLKPLNNTEDSLKSLPSNNILEEPVDDSRDSLKSPEPEDIEPCKEPKIIPLEKPLKMPLCQADLLFKKLINYSKEERVVEEVVSQFVTSDPEYIAQMVLEIASRDIYDKATNTHNTYAPPLTETQMVLIGFMVRLDKTLTNSVQDYFLKKTEIIMFSKVASVQQANPLSRMYLAICKARKDMDRIRKFCCECFYFMGDLAVPVFFNILTSWIDVLPKFAASKDFPMAKVLVQLVHTKDCNIPGFNLIPLRDLLHHFYGYPKEKLDCNEVFKDIFNRYIANPSRNTDLPILLFCKHQSDKWILDTLDKYFKPLVHKIPTENYKATVLVLIGKICKNFKTTELLKETVMWLESLKSESTTGVLLQAINYCLRFIEYKKIST